MSAVVLKTYGDAEHALEITQNAVIPTPKKDDLLVRVKAASVNPIDCRMRAGYGKAIFAARAPLPIILGRDFAGVVEEVGETVSAYKKGDEVWGIVSPFRPEGLKQGSHSEFICVPQTECAKKPSTVDFVSAASLPYVALTTWSALMTQNGMSPNDYAGKKVLIHAGAGGVGTFAIQFLKQHGAIVATTCSTDNVSFVKTLGADIVIDYKAEDYSKKLHDYDVVYDLLGKQHTDPSLSILTSTPCSANIQTQIQAVAEQCLAELNIADDSFDIPKYKAILKKFDAETRELVPKASAYVSIVGPMMPLTDNKGLHLGMQEYVAVTLAKKIEQLKLHGRRFNYAIFEPNKAGLDYVTSLVSAGKIKPQVGQVFTFEAAVAAHKAVDAGHVRGKVVLRPKDE